MLLYTIKQVREQGKIPKMCDRKVRHLIWRGELQKKGEYDGIDYIRAVNLGTERMPHWYLGQDEIDAWIIRKARSKKK